MSDTKGERRESARQKARTGMRVSGKYFWIAIENSRAKRAQRRAAKTEPPPTTNKPAQSKEDAGA